MEIIILRLSFLQKLLWKHSIKISQTGLIINEKTYPFPELKDIASVNKGLIFLTLQWGPHKKRFFRNAVLEQFLYQALKARIDYWKLSYQSQFDRAEKAVKSFQSYVSKAERFIRNSKRIQLLDIYQEFEADLAKKEEFKILGFDVSFSGGQLLEFLTDSNKFCTVYNNKWKQVQLATNQELFNHFEAHPLTQPQQLACVTDEDNVLLIAGAGTGKTSTMAAKATYLVKQGFAKSEEILMLAYGKDAKAELKDRVYKDPKLHNVDISTFHSLGLKIIGLYENTQTIISDLATDEKKYTNFVDDQISEMISQQEQADDLKHFLGKYLYPKPNDLDIKTQGEYLKYVIDSEIRSLSGQLVKSFEELTICNYLYMNGIDFQYEPKYPHNVGEPGRRAYQPDFYIPVIDAYVEHFGIDKEGDTRPDIDKYKYNKDREWKIQQHAEQSTYLIQTFSWQSKSKEGLEGHLERAIIERCKELGITFVSVQKPKKTNEIFSTLKEVNINIYQKFSKLIADFLALFKSSSLQLEDIKYKLPSGYNEIRWNVFMRIFTWVYERYESELKAKSKLDFADMINRATAYVQKHDFHTKTKGKFKYKYILVDEFQDISPIRAQLVKSLRDVSKDCALFCVGDDWQAIYRFTGSDLKLTTEYASNFGKTESIMLDKTFRFNDRIEKVASAFVQKNPHQLKKILLTHKKSEAPEVCLITNLKEKALVTAFEAIYASAGNSTVSILVLSRFTKSLPELSLWQKKYPKYKIRFMSAHASKGKQSDFVIILDVVDGRYGFPSKVMTDPILESLLPKLEKFAFAEERRLFYVALSRAKETVFIHAELGKESEFIKEIKQYDGEIRLFLNDLDALYKDDAVCPVCLQGKLIPYNGRHGLFYRCSLGQDYCDTKINPCTKCESSPIQKNEKEYFCASTDCDYKAEICPACGTGMLAEKQNRANGNRFVGCSNYRYDSLSSCNYTRSIYGNHRRSGP